MQQLWVFWSLHKSLNKPQTSKQTTRSRRGLCYPQEVGTASKEAGPAGEGGAGHFAPANPCSPFQAGYPGAGAKTQAKTTVLIHSLNPSEPKETSVAALENRSCRLQLAMGGQTAPSIAVQFNTSTANFACSQPPFLKGSPGLTSKEF